MLNYPAIFFLIAVGAGGFAFTGNATGDVNTVRALFVIFLVGSILSFLLRKRSGSDRMPVSMSRHHQ